VRSSVRLLSPFFIAVISVIFLVPFAFMITTAGKTQAEAGGLNFSLPDKWVLFDNIKEAVKARDYMLITAFVNSTIITVASVAIMVVLAAMVGYVLQRRRGWWTPIADVLILSGLIIPPAVVPTIWTLQKLELFKTLQGMVLIESRSGSRSRSCSSGRSSRRSRASSTRRRRSTAPARCARSSA
jgi:raffinose/stachyose/melibiose transport system permease protein